MTTRPESTLCQYKACCRRTKGHAGDHDYAPDTEYALLREALLDLRKRLSHDEVHGGMSHTRTVLSLVDAALRREAPDA